MSNYNVREAHEARVSLDQPVRVLAVEWEPPPHWVYGQPVLVLEPVLRYTLEGDPAGLVMNTLLQLGLMLERGEPITDEPDVTDELERHGWSLQHLRALAERVLQGEEVSDSQHPDLQVHTQWVRFYFWDPERNEVEFEEVSAPPEPVTGPRS